MNSLWTQDQIQAEIDRLNAYRTELRRVMIGIRNPEQQSYKDRHAEISRVTLRIGLLYERLDD